MSSVNEKAFMFVGEIIGYTDKIKGNTEYLSSENKYKFYGEGRGYKVKPVHSINFPVKTEDYYELFIFGVTSWCAPKLQDAYLAVGTKVRMAAYQSDLLAQTNDKIKLQIKTFDRFSVVQDDEEFQSSEDSEFDYKKWKPLATKIVEKKDYDKIVSFDNFLYLETNKDLIRLRKNITKEERNRILERLIYNPKIYFPSAISPYFIPQSSPDFLRLLEKGKKIPKIKLTKTEKEFIIRRKELEQSGYFNL